MNNLQALGSKRLEYLDVAKGIGILFVLFGHSTGMFVSFLGALAWSFHMPLFFLLSGLCFKEKDNKQNAIGLVRRLWPPYIFTIILFVVFYLLCGDYENCRNWLWGGVYCSGYDYTVPFYIKGVGGIWFFIALFWSKLILNYIIKLPEYLVCVIVAFLAYWGVFSYSRFVMPLEIQNGCVGLLFLYIGLLGKKYEFFKNSHLPLLLFSLIVWGLALTTGSAGLSLVNCKVELITVISSCCACYVVIETARYLVCNKLFVFFKRVFIWIGRSTAIILSFHIFELHTGILKDITSFFFSTDDGDIIFVVRLVWCLCFAFLVPKIPLIKKVYSV